VGHCTTQEQPSCSRGAVNPTFFIPPGETTKKVLETATENLGAGASTDSDHGPERYRAERMLGRSQY
jgi:hypothetical protein